VLREEKGWEAVPYQWAAAGFMGAVKSGRTNCGILFGGVVYLGYLHGTDASGVPEIEDKNRQAAIASVRELYGGFVEKFGDSDCLTLTGCDWSKKEDVKRYFGEKVYRHTCYPQFEYVLEKLLKG